MFKEEILKMSGTYFSFCRKIDKKYILLKKLGEGRYGKVYLAYNQEKSELVALKMLKTN